MWDKVNEQFSYEVAGHIETSYEVGDWRMRGAMEKPLESSQGRVSSPRFEITSRTPRMRD